LSNICRYGGHSDRFYSVAEHCCLLYDNVNAYYKPLALLHDAAEAYIGDIPRPVKRKTAYLVGTYYVHVGSVEETILKIIVQELVHMSLVESDLHYVSYADNRMLAAEKDQVLGNAKLQWAGLYEAFDQKLNFWDPITAEQEYLQRYAEILRNRGL
jgi:5'-deoxynucleotidase YfbR-like HD superfamily hydrolase